MSVHRKRGLLEDGSDSESESDVPEVTSLAQGKADARKLEAEVQNARNEARRKLKDANRQKDAKLKERAEATRGSRNEGAREGISAVERMERAMQEAAGEDEDESEGEDEDGGSDEESEFGGFGDDALAGPSRPRGSSSAEYLPDEIFESALSSLAKESQEKRGSASKKQKLESSKKTRQKSNRRRDSAKDIIFGSKIIRTLPSSKSQNLKVASASRTLPSKNAKHFVQRTLGLTSSASARVKRNGWERRAANVGSMQSHSGLPAARFVRST